MKKTLLFSVAALAGSALFADTTYESDTSVGICPVTSSAKETMVAVPFIGTNGNIQVDQMVKASGLSAGDKIYALPTGSGNAYQVWELNGSRTAWVPVLNAQVGSGAAAFTSPAANSTNIARGQAFWLVRSSAATTTFYVMGVGATGDVETSVSAGWNLVGQSSATGTKSLADIASAVGAKGHVRFPDGTRYIYSGSAWKSVAPGSNARVAVADPSAVKLPVGNGFWIVSTVDSPVNVNL